MRRRFQRYPVDVSPRWEERFVGFETERGLVFTKGAPNRRRRDHIDCCPCFIAQSPGATVRGELLTPWMILGPQETWASFMLPDCFRSACLTSDLTAIWFASDVTWGEITLDQALGFLASFRMPRGSSSEFSFLSFSAERVSRTGFDRWGDIADLIAPNGELVPHLIGGIVHPHGVPIYELGPF